MYCCVECGKNTDKIFLQTTSYFQVNRCKYCGNFVDKYFEISTTVQFIELLLIKDKVLRHFIFNISIPNRIFVLYSIILVWIKLILFIRNSPFGIVINHLYRHQYQKKVMSLVSIQKILLYLVCIALEYLSYTLIIKLFDFADDVPTILILKTIVFSSYSQIFNFLNVIWDYQDSGVHEVLASFLTTLVNIKSVSILTKKPFKGIFKQMVFAKLASIRISLLAWHFLH